jgi:Lysozyme like domain
MAGNVSVSGGKVRTPVGDAPVVPLFLVGTGLYLLWFAAHYFGRAKVEAGGNLVTLWPTDPIKAFLSGHPQPVTTGALPSAADVLSGETASASAGQQQAAQAQLAAQAGGVTPGTGQANPNALGQAVAAGAGTGGTYDHAQLVALWQQAGGQQAAANNAACHALQESSGNPNAISYQPGGNTNVGLWQLETPGGVGAGYTVAQLKDPLLNARLTVMHTANGTNWSQWATAGCP